MAKYKITSIPDFRKGGSKKKKKGYSRLEGTTPAWQTSTLRDPQGALNLVQPGEEAFDITRNDLNYIPFDQRTEEQLRATMPTVYPYGYGANNLTGKIGPELVGTIDFTNRRKVTSNRYMPYDLQGNRLNCSEGYRPYNGQCLPIDLIKKLEQEELDAVDEKYALLLAEEERLMQEEYQKKLEAYNQKYVDYVTNALKKGNKHKKGVLDPIMSFSKEKWEANNMQEQYDNPDSQIQDTYYMEKKDLGDGKYEVNLYPREAIQGLMHRWGVRPYEFGEYHGLDAKKINKEFKDQLNYSNYIYQKQGTEMLDDCISQGYSAEECEKRLVNKNYGTSKGIKQKFEETAKAFDVEYNADKFFVDDSGVLYKEDKDGNISKYGNNLQSGNNDYTIFDPYATDKNESPFAPLNQSNYNSAYGGFGWQPVDKKNVKTTKDGNLLVNGKEAGFYDYSFSGRKGDKSENTILNNYKSTINDLYKDQEEAINVGNTQAAYAGYNTNMYDFVYGNPTTDKLDKIYATDLFTPNSVSFSYADAYNKAVDKINNLASEKDPEKRRLERAKIVDEFISKAGTFSNKVPKGGTEGGFYEATFNPAQLGEGSLVYKNARDVKAYKNTESFNQARDNVKKMEAENWLRAAYLNNIDPSEKNVSDWEYRGEGDEQQNEGTLSDKYGSFQNYLYSNEGQNFINNYLAQPSFAQQLVSEADRWKQTNLAKDTREENMARAKLAMDRSLKSSDMFSTGLGQVMSLINQPGYTIGEWGSGNLADPLYGMSPDIPTEQYLNQINQTFGPGAADVYLKNKYNKIDSSLLQQGINLVNPFHWAAQAGTGIRGKIEGDPEASWSDIGLNTAFAFLPVSKGLRALGASKLLPASTYLPKAAQASKYVTRGYNAARNLATPLNALHGYFGYEAFAPHVDEEGNVQQGFAIDAAKNMYDAFTEGDQVDWGKVSENVLPLYMGYHIGKGNLGMGADLVRDVVAPNYEFSNFTDRFNQPLQNLKFKTGRNLTLEPVNRNGRIFFESPLDFNFPSSVYDFNRNYNFTQPTYEGPVPESTVTPNELPIPFEQEGGALPKASLGLPFKKSSKSKKKTSYTDTKISPTLEKFIPEVKPISKAATSTSVRKAFNTSEIPTIQVIKEKLPGYTQRRQTVQNLKDLGYLGSETGGMDMLKAAKSDESLNKLMQLAIDFDRTGYRQVSGEYKPQGQTMGGYGNSWDYDMTKRQYGNLLSERDNMLAQGVDLTDPLSLGAYQATSIPMENYGYREGGLDYIGPGMGALYLSSLPEKINPDYGTFQFRVKQPTDFSTGNWRDWYNRYILNKESAFEKVDDYTSRIRTDLQPTKLYFDTGYSKGLPSFLDRSIAGGQGLNTRRWIGGRGYSAGDIDPTFEFMDLKNMSAAEYNAMEELKNSLIRDYQTGWRGKYKKGGALPRASHGLPFKKKPTVKTEPKPEPKPKVKTIKETFSENVDKALAIGSIATLGTANNLIKKAFPVMINPIHIPTLGFAAGERTMIGPFTGSPLNFIPFYGKDLKSEMGPNEAFRYFGDTLDYVKLNNNKLDSAHGPLLRIGRSTIVNDKGQWFEQGTPNASYTTVFGVRANPDAPGSNLRYMPKGNRNGVLIGDISSSNPRIINLNDPGATVYRRMFGSEKMLPVDLDNPWDWKNYGGNLQALAERYGYAALLAAGLGLTGINTPQEYLDEYVTNPLIQGYDTLYNFLKPLDNKVEELLINPWRKQKGGVSAKLTKEEINNYIAQGYIIEEE